MDGGEDPDPVGDGEPGPHDHRVDLVVGDLLVGPLERAQRRGRGGRRQDPQRPALGPRDAGLGAATADRGVEHAQLGHLAAEQGEDGVGVVAGVLVDRQQLEREAELAQVAGEPLDRGSDDVLVVPERKDQRRRRRAQSQPSADE